MTGDSEDSVVTHRFDQTLWHSKALEQRHPFWQALVARYREDFVPVRPGQRHDSLELALRERVLLVRLLAVIL